MREIKFRAWSKKHKKMQTVDAVNWDWESGEIIDISLCDGFGGEYHNPIEDYTLMQYTGLLDKNGKEVYEGDVVKQTWEDTEQYIGTVEYNESEAMFLINYPDGGGSVMNHSTLRTEVIGNIHENPELLEDSNEGK